MKGKILYPHNQQAFDETMYILNNTNKVAIVQATGSGKGVLAAEFINKPFSGKNIIVLAPTKDILMNYRKSLGVISPNVLFMTYAGLSAKYQKHLAEGNSDFNKLSTKADLLIVDEFHRVGAEKWGEAVISLMDAMEKRDGKIIGLSATPVRYLDNSRDMVDEVFQGVVVQGVTLEEAILQGILPSFKYIVSMYGFKEDIYRLQKQVARMRKNSEYFYSEGLKKAEEVVKKLKLHIDEDLVLKETIQKEIRTLNTPQKWIVFCANIEELQEINEHLTVWFDRPINVFTTEDWEASENKLNVFTVHSEESQKDSSLNLEGFYNVDKGISVITCVNKLNEGNHVEGITGVIMLRRTISPIIYLQQMGRALSAGNKNKPIIFDFINNYNNVKKIEKEDEGFKSIKSIRDKVNLAIENESTKENWRGRRIVIKNAAKPIMELFAILDDLVVVNNTWSERELKILHIYYPMRGAAEVQRHIPKRTLEAIDARARIEGLRYSPRTNEVKVNKDNTLEWNHEENTIILQYFKAYYNTGKLTRNDCAVRLASEGVLQSRTPRQIIDQYERLCRGFIAKDFETPENEGKPWTVFDLDYLHFAYKNNIPASVISMTIGRSIPAVKSKARSEGIVNAVGKRKKWTPEEERFAWLHKDDMTYARIGEVLGRPEQGVAHKIDRLRLDKAKLRYQSSLPKKANNDIWTKIEEDLLDAYWGDSIEVLCSVLVNKTEKQIRGKIQKDCMKYGCPNPLRSRYA